MCQALHDKLVAHDAKLVVSQTHKATSYHSMIDETLSLTIHS